uniref:F-box domain-containing protein n=1 Tax=Psilocybe cubensis TaxID=181762 RepID=A0A8H7XSH4_PSICU
MISTSLIHMPTELLLNVLEDLRPKDILNMAKACRRLNLIAIPYLLKEMGLPDPEEFCVVKASSHRYTDELAALSVYFPLLSINHFYCIISHRRDLEDSFIPPSHISWLIDNIRRVNILLSRLSSVGTFSLVIDSWGSGWSLRSEIVQGFVAWVIDLVHTAMRKSCASLQILHCHPTTVETNYNFELLRERSGPKLVRTIRDRIHRLFTRTTQLEDPQFVGNGWRYRKAPSLGPFRCVLPRMPQSALTRLDIDSEFLLVPPFSAWTFEVLRSSPIITLVFSLPSCITKKEFSVYHFPRIAASVPKLLELRCSFPDEGFLNTVVENLHQTPLLRKLVCSLSFSNESISLPSIPRTIPIIKLVHLTSFTGSPDQAACFLRYPVVLPSLQFINLISDSYYQSQTFDTDYTGVAAHFASINRRMMEMNINPCISLCLANQCVVLHGIALVPDGITDCFQQFSIVSRLTLEVVYQHPSAETEETSPTHDSLIHYTFSWMNVFRGLRYLTLAVKCNKAIDDPSKLHIVSSIKNRFPEMVSVNLVNLTIEPRKYHYHWSNAHDDWERGTYNIPMTPSYERKSRELCVCSDF